MISEVPPLAISGFITIALGLIVLLWGIYSAKQKQYNNHKRIMQLAILILSAFLIQYIIRAFVLGQETHFEGSDTVKYFLFYPILIIHITGAVITIGLIVRHVLQARKNEMQSETNQVYFPKEYRQDHRKLGSMTYKLWLLSYLGGIIVFIFLYV